MDWWLVQGDVRRFFREFPRRVFLLLMLVGAAFITDASLSYFDPEVLPPFVIEQLPVVKFPSTWMTALRIHVASALFAFPLCLLLLTRTLQRRPTWHRWLGRVTGMVLLLALVPTGALLSFEAKGGRFVTAGFLLSGAIVAACTVWGVRAARRKELATHRRAMQHVVAQMSVAVTSRALIMGLDVVEMDPDTAYAVALWVPVVFSSLVVELFARRSPSVENVLIPSVERIRREVSPLALSVRARSVVRPFARLGR